MRPSRQRYYGHPELVDYVKRLGKRARAEHLRYVLVGDLAQARGGRAQSGHSSHQTGLDVDVWFMLPEAARGPKLSDELREQLELTSVLERGRIVRSQRRRVRALLKLAVADPRVDRVFVNAAIKDALCKSEPERGWLRKLRPWYGHDDHLHARLSCAAGDSGCTPQASLPEGDGCDKLDDWLRPKAPRKPVPAPKPTTTAKLVPKPLVWPAACDALLPPSERPVREPATGEAADAEETGDDG
jgi:penicillin-insensitive murein DD-endopeptidase